MLIEDGRIERDTSVDLPRSRERGGATFAASEKLILDRVLQEQTASIVQRKAA
jgi:sulfonate transport system ATP-binding protein